MNLCIKELYNGQAVILTEYGQPLSYFNNLTEARLAYLEWNRSNDDLLYMLSVN